MQLWEPSQEYPKQTTGDDINENNLQRIHKNFQKKIAAGEDWTHDRRLGTYFSKNETFPVIYRWTTASGNCQKV